MATYDDNSPYLHDDNPGTRKLLHRQPHSVEFDSKQDFQNFTKDEERKQFLHLKERSIESVLLIKGTAL